MKYQVLNHRIFIPGIKKLTGKNFSLLVFCFLIFPVIYGQELISNAASTTASATIINEMLGVEKLDNINFTKKQTGTIPSLELQQDLVETNSAFIKIIGTEYDYSVTIPSTEILVKESETSQTMNIGSFAINYSYENTNDKMLHISASLHVSKSQATGTYSSNIPLTIIVNNN